METLYAVIQQLKDLFKDKSELRGFDDWDRLIGCVMALQNFYNQLSEQQIQEKGE